MTAATQQVRHEWYQTDQKVVITLFIKNANKRNCEIVIKSDQVMVSGDDLPKLNFNLLHPINMADSKSNSTFSTKVEISLVKLIGERWPTLEKATESAPTVAPASVATVQENASAIEAPSNASGTSGVAPKNPKDWDKLVNDLWEKEDLDKAESDELNNLFQKIYSGSNPDIQRAMNKSFTESGGTVLSTNWNEVGSAPVEVKPPDGTEYHHWKK